VRIGRGLRSSIQGLIAHKVRATLAVASVAIGVAAVLVTSAIGRGAEREVLRGVEAMGTNLVVVRPAQAKRLVARKEVRGVVTSLRVEDQEAIARLADVAAVAPSVDGAVRVTAGGGSMAASLLGTTATLAGLRNLSLRAGRFLDADDEAQARRVAVLGNRVAETLFAGEEAIGETIRARGIPFEVIGVLRAKGVLADGSDQDNQIFIPVRTALRRVFNTRRLGAVFVGVRDPKRMDEAEDEVRGLLHERHRLEEGKPDDFAVQNQAKLLMMQKITADSITLLASGLAAVSLLVGGTGILALMLLSVKERTGEIGLRMAVGARPQDILLQFLTEAALLSMVGWLAGASVGGLATVALSLGTEWRVGLPTATVLSSLAMTAVSGLGFGAFPARKAARLPPIRALAAA
jgi:putative ABC transport system permease protein